jgi:hypothetical protein
LEVAVAGQEFESRLDEGFWRARVRVRPCAAREW